MNSLYGGFFTLFGECMYYDQAYNDYTKNETKNVGHDMSQIFLSKLVNATGTISGMFLHMNQDFKADKLSLQDYGKFLRYYNLILTDSMKACTILNKNSELVQAVSKYSKGKDL